MLVSLTTYAVFAIMFAGTPASQRPGSDGHYTWLYTRSLVFDHDIDFKNDYELCGDPYSKNVDRGTGHPDNPFYVGPSVVWAPILWTLHHVAPMPHGAPDDVKQACRGPLVATTLGIGPVLGGLIVFIMYRLARRLAGDGPAALTAGLLGLCTQLPVYAALMPSYSHVHDAFWAALVMLSSVRAAEKPSSLGRWALTGALVGTDFLQRPVSVAIIVVPAALAMASLWRRWGRLVLSLGLLGALAFVCGALPQMLIYKKLYAKLLVGAPHGRFYMQYGHAHPWLVLFAPHGGLLFTAPVLWLAALGFVFGLARRKTRVLFLSTLVTVASVVWLSSAALDWHGSGTFGARRLTSLLPLLAAPTVLVIARIDRWLSARSGRPRVALGITVLGVGAFVIIGAGGALVPGRVSTEVGATQAGLYGEGATTFWRLLDDHVGDVAILPAELVFHMRYGLPMRSFRDATEPVYQRNYRTLEWETQELDFKEEGHKSLTSGFVNASDGIHPKRHDASIVFAAQWPFATTLTVHAHARKPTIVRVGRRRLWGTAWYGELHVGMAPADASVTIPAEGFDSGIMELVFQTPDLGANVSIESIKIDDTTSYPPPLSL